MQGLGCTPLGLHTGWVGPNVAEQLEHGQRAQAFGDDGYVWRWGQSTFEDWQSEFLQLCVSALDHLPGTS